MHSMDKKANKEIVDRIFDMINSSEKIVIPDELERFAPSKDKYPREILDWLQQLNQDEFITKLKNLDLSENGSLKVNSEILDNEISKLLYMMVWKQGDLKKFQGIIDGLTSDKDDIVLKEPFVLYQLGRHIAHGEPMIDQHVIRAFKVFIEVGKLNPIDFSTKPSTKMDKNSFLVNSNKKALFEKYIDWVKLRGSKHHKTNDIDNIMFALGKYLKSELSKK
jgi:hypothetical protein